MLLFSTVLTHKEETQACERKSQYSDICAQREMELPYPDKQAAK